MIYKLFELIGRDYFYEGRMYNAYYISHMNTDFQKPYYYHYYDVRDDRMRRVIHKVVIQNNGESIYGVKCDCVLHLNDGRYGLIEVKLGGQKGIDEGIEHPLKLKNLIEENEIIRKPEFLMVITGFTEMAYTTNEGIMIVPIGCLKD